MLREDSRRTHIANPGLVIELYESTNQPLVQPKGSAAQPATAVVAVLQEEDGLRALVVLSLAHSRTNVIFVGDPAGEAEFSAAVEEGLVFAESMGFILDSTGWASLDDGQREELAARLGAFRPPQPKQEVRPVERKKTSDPLAVVARLFAAFVLPLLLGLGACSGMSNEQRRRSAEIHYDLGTNLLANGDTQQALYEYLAAEKDDDDLPQVQNALGLLKGFSLGRYDEAEAHFKKALDLNPGYSEAQNNLGSFYLARGRYADAVPLFEKALADPLYREREVAECNLGWALYKAGKPDQGVGRLRAALLLKPKYCKGWRQLGSIQVERGAMDDAADAFDRYTQSCPDAADAWLQSGLLAARRGKKEQARIAFNTCAERGKEKDLNTAAECARQLRDLGK